MVHPRARILPVVVIWLLLAAYVTWRGWAFVRTGTTPDTDAIMRMVEVRDLLGGQGWFDLRQTRFGPAGVGGVAMHWSRVGDLLPAALTLVLGPAIGEARALLWAAIFTPLVLLSAAVALSFTIVRALAPAPIMGRASIIMPTAVVLFTSLAALAMFVPGDVDHHNLQLLAVLLLVAAACATPSTASGAVAGIAVTLAMTIGLETAPHLAAVLAAVGARWVWAPDHERAFVVGLGLGQVASALVSLAVFMPRPWQATQCDSWTPAIFWLVLGSGGLFALAGTRNWGGRPARAALLAAGGLVLVGAVAVAYPDCLHHPAGTDPLLWRYWMDGISENEAVTAMIARGEWDRAILNLGSAPLVLIVGVGMAVAGARAGRDMRAWWPALAACAAALAITLMHVRGQGTLWGVAAPLAAALIARARKAGGWRMVAAWLTLPPLGAMLLAAASMPAAKPDATAAQTACYTPEVLAALNRLPPSTLVVPITAEPMIVSRTRHRALGATYHRNVRGNHLLIAGMIASPQAGRAFLREGGARNLLFCPGFDMSGSYVRGNPRGLAAALTADRAPGWLHPLARFAGDVRLYRID